MSGSDSSNEESKEKVEELPKKIVHSDTLAILRQDSTVQDGIKPKKKKIRPTSQFKNKNKGRKDEDEGEAMS